MPSFTIRDIPDDVYQRVAQAAKANRRSINSEIICSLESMFPSSKLDKEVFMAEVRQLRSELSDKIYLTDEIIEAAKSEARP